MEEFMFGSGLFPLTIFVLILVLGIVVSRLCAPDRNREWDSRK